MFLLTQDNQLLGCLKAGLVSLKSSLRHLVYLIRWNCCWQQRSLVSHPRTYRCISLGYVHPDLFSSTLVVNSGVAGGAVEIGNQPRRSWTAQGYFGRGLYCSSNGSCISSLIASFHTVIYAYGRTLSPFKPATSSALDFVTSKSYTPVRAS